MFYPSLFKRPTKVLELNKQTIPHAAAADIATVNTWVYQIVITNTTAGDLTIDIHDKQDTPVALLEDVTISANSQEVLTYPCGELMDSGINWQASGAGLKGSVLGLQVQNLT